MPQLKQKGCSHVRQTTLLSSKLCSAVKGHSEQGSVSRPQ